MGAYPDRRITHISADPTGERWLETETWPGLTRTREVTAGPWSETRTDCFCCSCGDHLTDPACRNHGFAGQRPCEDHAMPGTPWEHSKVMPATVQEALAGDRS